MPYQSYLQNCSDLLNEFEKSQLQMLKMDLNRAGYDFFIQMKKMRQYFELELTELENHNFTTDRDKILLTKQIERLLIFIKEMDLHISEFQTKSSPDENEVIFIFERHLFKNIYRKHLDDFAAIIT